MNETIFLEKMLQQVLKESKIMAYDADSVLFHAIDKKGGMIFEVDAGHGQKVDSARNFKRDLQRMQRAFLYLQNAKIREAQRITNIFNNLYQRWEFECARWGYSMVNLDDALLQADQWKAENWVFLSKKIFFQAIGTNANATRYLLRIWLADLTP